MREASTCRSKMCAAGSANGRGVQNINTAVPRVLRAPLTGIAFSCHAWSKGPRSWGDSRQIACIYPFSRAVTTCRDSCPAR